MKACDTSAVVNDEQVLKIQMRDIKDNLEQEASFWRVMLKECPDTHESDHQRMREALLLVEYKLAQMMDSYH